MSENLNIPLREPVQAWQAIKSAWDFVKPRLIAGQRLVLSIRLENRSDAQNRVLHARLSDIAKQCEWAGRKWGIDEWKRLLTAAWCRARNEGVEIVPAIDGKGFDVLYQRTSKLSRRDCAELCDYLLAWGSDLPVPVRWSIASLCGEVDAESGEMMEMA